MKKLLIVLLILAVAGGVFAQGLNITGSLKTGISVINNGDGERTGDFVALNHSGDNENRLDIKGTYSQEDFGVVFNIRASDDLDALTGAAMSGTSGRFGNFRITNAYAWLDGFNDIINIKAGKIDDGAWGTGGDKNWGMATGDGLRLEIKPIAGLNVGFFFPTNVSSINKKGEEFKDLGASFGALVIGARFENDMFGFGFSIDLDGRDDRDAIGTKGGKLLNPAIPENVDEGTPAIPAQSNPLSDFTAVFGFNLKAVENLTAAIEAKIYTTDKYTNDNKGVGFSAYPELFGMWLTEKFEYAIADNFRAGLKMHQQFASVKDAFADGDALDSALKFVVYGGYDITSAITAALDVEANFSLDGDDPGDITNGNNLSFKPKVTFNLGGGASVDIFDKVSIDLDEKDARNGSDDDRLSNQFQIDFTYSF